VHNIKSAFVTWFCTYVLHQFHSEETNSSHPSCLGYTFLDIASPLSEYLDGIVHRLRVT